MARCCVGVVLVLAVLCPLVMAEEMPPEGMDKILKQADNDEALDQWTMDQMEKFAKDFMWRPKCTALERTQFTIAELEAKADHGDKAIEVLEKLGAAATDADVKSAVQYDIGRVYQRRLKDPDRAAEAYKKVTGRYAPMAQRDLVKMWKDGGQVGKAIEHLQAAITQSKDKGEKFGLLQRLGHLCQEADRTEDALAAYRQIAEEFTAKDIEELKAAVVKRVTGVYETIWDLHKQDRAKELQEEIRRLRIWGLQLDAAGREDEAKTYVDEFDAARRKFDERRKNKGKEPVVEKKEVKKEGEPK